MSHRPIASFWFGNRLGPIHELCLRSWARWNPENRLYSFGQVENLPKGVHLVDASLIPGASEKYSEERIKSNPSGYSNLFRALLLKHDSLLWCDTDVLMIGQQRHSPESFTFGYESPVAINGAILALPADSDVLDQIISNLLPYSGKQILFGDLGPSLLTEQLLQAGLANRALQKSEFYEISPTEMWKLFSTREYDDVAKRLDGRSFVHLWNESLKSSGIDFSKYRPQSGSFLYEVDTEFWRGWEKEVDDEQLQAWKERLSRAKRRNVIASFVPAKIRRLVLAAAGRKIDSGF